MQLPFSGNLHFKNKYLHKFTDAVKYVLASFNELLAILSKTRNRNCTIKANVQKQESVL